MTVAHDGKNRFRFLQK